MPGASESSTVLWQRAHVMPMERSRLESSKKPRTPTTAFSDNNATVTAGSSRFTWPAFNCLTSAGGSALASTLSPRPSAAFGLKPGADAAVGSAGDRFVQPQRAAPKILVAEIVEAKGAAAARDHHRGVLPDGGVGGRERVVAARGAER